MPLRRLEAFLFDLDGTLLDAREAFISSYNYAFRVLGLPPLPSDLQEALRKIRRPFHEILESLLPSDYQDGVELERFVADLQYFYGGVFLEQSQLVPGAREALRELKARGAKIAVVTARVKLAAYVLPALRHFHLADYIDVVISSKEVGQDKPSPKPFLEAAKRLQVEPRRCAVVGDSPYDIIGGKRAGMFTIAYANGFFEEEMLLNQKPDMLVRDLREILKLLQPQPR